jgi:16S rRNA (cytosine1402-N4)-methyltransferase
VLAEPAVDLLVTNPDGIYLDGTVGGGGHSLLIAKKLSKRGTLIGCDRDADAIAQSRKVLPETAVLIQCRFSEIKEATREFTQRGVWGVLLDLGVSSFQLDTAERGFSHRFSGPLDLRMDPSRGETAADLLKDIDLSDLTRIIFAYGEDSQARRIAKAILETRARHPIETTDDLAQIIDRSVPATRAKSLARVFQALRIAVNHELEELEQGLVDCWDMLIPGGRLVVISYHSLEDRIVKTFMRSKAEPPQPPAYLPMAPTEPPEGKLPFRKPLLPSETEIDENPRARSAKLRVVEKILS